MEEKTPTRLNPSTMPYIQTFSAQAEREQQHLNDLVRAEHAQKIRQLLTQFIDNFIVHPGTQNLRSDITYKKYVDGSEYKGQIKGKKKNGVGIYSFGTNDKYCGNWANDEPNGEGMIFFENMERYEGT